MQEEITQKTLALCVETGKMTAQLLQQAMKKVLADMEKHKTNPQLHHGKQTIRQLMKHGAGVSNIEITDQNIKAFLRHGEEVRHRLCPEKDTSGEIPRYLVFFKGRDADVSDGGLPRVLRKESGEGEKALHPQAADQGQGAGEAAGAERGREGQDRDRGLETMTGN